MTQNMIGNNWKISDDLLEMRTSLKDIYNELVNPLKLFPNCYSLFAVELVCELLYKNNIT